MEKFNLSELTLTNAEVAELKEIGGIITRVIEQGELFNVLWVVMQGTYVDEYEQQIIFAVADPENAEELCIETEGQLERMKYLFKRYGDHVKITCFNDSRLLE